MTFQRQYDDASLAAAIAAAHSWRGVLRELGLQSTSAGSLRAARRHADRLGLDYSHFTGQRKWTDKALADAIEAARSWTQVAALLGVSGGSSLPALKGHALRLGLDTSHIGSRSMPESGWTFDPSSACLRHAGSLIAAAWFALCGYEVSWPLEPYRYDLLVRSADRTERVQVKTTARRLGRVWAVDIAPGGKGAAYDPDDVDSFFVIDAELCCYFIPIAAVAGFGTIGLSAYGEYLVAQSGFITACQQQRVASAV
jgi:hypothetical protein